MTQRIPDEAVEQALAKAHWHGLRVGLFANSSTEIARATMEDILEASGAVFLTDEERKALLWRIRSGKRGPWSWDQVEALLESAREKLL